VPVTSDRSSSRIPWLKLGAETFFVVLGVLLALALDEWRQDRREQEVVTLALQNIRSEIQENREEIRRTLSYHRDLLARLEKTPGMPVAFKPAILRNSAWQAAQSSQAAARMDFSAVAAFSKMKDRQDLYQGFSTQVLPMVYQPGRPSRMILSDFAFVEGMLLQAYDEAERAIPKD
jgi:type II secretory pathway pseudopilin PulG